ncbi:hypothetical protein ANCDUO_14737 [Ancylostoma duodenale]|uniref:Cytochrome P450 n=1 Tax=Ancylostoma duodenale TaxID=51022 RepID=A0A0C2G2E3_9BILA|nr:hypothetical protein ANCDUO_14737 [Ancylostoma duodenale]
MLICDALHFPSLMYPTFSMVLVALAFASIAVSYLVLWMPRLIQWIKQRMRIIELVDRLPGPRAFPLVGCAYQFSFDSYKFTYLMEEIFEKFSDGLNGNGMFRMWLGPVPVVFICRADAAKEATILLEQFSQFADTGRCADVFPLIKLCTLDVICGMFLKMLTSQPKDMYPDLSSFWMHTSTSPNLKHAPFFRSHLPKLVQNRRWE